MEITDRFNYIKDENIEDIMDYNNIKINLNECNFKHSPILIHDLKNKIDQSEIIKYSSLYSETHLKLVNNISDYLYISNNQIIISNSIYNSINNILLLFATNKSKIVIFTPTINHCENLSKIMTNKIIKIQLDNTKIKKQDSQLDSYNLSDSFNNNRIIIFLSNPNNSTGYEWTETELKRMFNKYPHILFIIDESYIDFSTLVSSEDSKIYSCTNCINEFKNIIIIRSFSKAFGLAGLGIGYIISNELNIDSLLKISPHRDVTELSKLSASIVLDNINFYGNQIDLFFSDKKKIITFCIQNQLKYIDTKCNFILLYAGNYAKKLQTIFLENNIIVKLLSNDYLNILYGYIKINIFANFTITIESILHEHKDNIHKCF
jgi:histidinol-phosphate aminotransferase